ncbi:MAG: tyrosine-type recombinase/integrase [Mangrovibacterium sp.]
MKKLYSEPKLFPTDRDMKKSWFVSFRFTNPDTGERKQFQFRGDINRHKSRHDRTVEGNSLCDALLKMLQEGWNPFTDETEKEYERKTLIDILDDMLLIKKSTLKIKSYRTYSDAKNLLQRWMVKRKMKIIMPYAFTPNHARQYADYLLSERNYQGKTFNSIIGFTKTFFNMLIAREVIGKNPFAKIEKMPHDIGKNHAFTKLEKDILIDHLKKHDVNLYRFVNFMYHGFIRRSEITQLQIGDIDFQNRSIRISSKISKNRKQESVSIPEGLWGVIQQMNLSQYPEHYFIFGRGVKPGPVMYIKPENITCRHKKHLVELGFPDTKTLYSWKHTGVCDYWEALKDPYAIMRQLRHHDLSITMIYLKSLGLTPNEKISGAKLYL